MQRTALVVAAVVLAACSESPRTAAPPAQPDAGAKKEMAKAVEPVAAQTAFFEMYKPARTWATDLLPLSLVSQEIPEIPNTPGKAARWTAVFVSPGRMEARTFEYSIADSGGTVHKGVTAGPAQPWSGPVPKSRPFQVTEFVVNSDAAYKTALTKADEWIKKNPTKKLTMSLGSASQFPAPVWYFLWGNEKAGFALYVNATTGMIITN